MPPYSNFLSVRRMHFPNRFDIQRCDASYYAIDVSGVIQLRLLKIIKILNERITDLTQKLKFKFKIIKPSALLN